MMKELFSVVGGTLLDRPCMVFQRVCVCVVHNVRLYSVLDTLVISGEDVSCSVVFGTLAWCVCVMLI